MGKELKDYQEEYHFLMMVISYPWGARNYNSGAGRANVYRYVASSNSWSLLGSAIAGETNEQFGVSTDISSNGTRLIVGTQAPNSVNSGRGSVRIYDLTEITFSDPPKCLKFKNTTMIFMLMI